MHTSIETAGPGLVEVLADDERNVGVRSIEVGDDWVWRLNGRPVFVRGCNYIGEQWLSALTPQRAADDVALAVAANLNTLRVHAHVTAPGFYDACDAAGACKGEPVACNAPPADSCKDASTSIQYGAVGACSVGQCGYTSTEVT